MNMSGGLFLNFKVAFTSGSLFIICTLLVSVGNLCALPAGFAVNDNLVTLFYITEKTSQKDVKNDVTYMETGVCRQD